jgi:Xaa-Pro dipeptidase
MRTAILGQPTPRMERYAEAGANALTALVETARPGLPASSVAGAGLAALEPVLDEVVFHHDFGYPVGINFPDTWTEGLGYMLRVENPRPLEVGMTFHLPMSLRQYGEFGINQSHTMVITETGAEALTKTAPRLRVLAG